MVRTSSRLDAYPERLASDATVEAVSDLATALARAEELADGRAVSIFGADVARQVLALGRLDEIVVQIVPLILGDGVRLFGEAPAPQVRLERTSVGTSGTLTDIRFRVAEPPISELGLDVIATASTSFATLPKPRGGRTVTARNVPLTTSSSVARCSLQPSHCSAGGPAGVPHLEAGDQLGPTVEDVDQRHRPVGTDQLRGRIDLDYFGMSSSVGPTAVVAYALVRDEGLLRRAGRGRLRRVARRHVRARGRRARGRLPCDLAGDGRRSNSASAPAASRCRCAPRHRVHGIELSEAMVEQLRAKPGADDIDVTIGDFSTTTRRRHVHPRLPRAQHDHEPDDAGRAGRVLPQRRERIWNRAAAS